MILVFDSGLGGLTVFREVAAALPRARYLYVADDAFFPYGGHGEAELVARVGALMGELIDAHHPDLVVIACNTASTLVLPHLRARYSVPFVGTVPAIKPACAASASKRVTVLGTEATVNRSPAATPHQTRTVSPTRIPPGPSGEQVRPFIGLRRTPPHPDPDAFFLELEFINLPLHQEVYQLADLLDAPIVLPSFGTVLFLQCVSAPLAGAYSIIHSSFDAGVRFSLPLAPTATVSSIRMPPKPSR